MIVFCGYYIGKGKPMRKKKSREQIVDDVLKLDEVEPTGSPLLDIELYKDKMLDEALNELLPDGLLIANHRWLLDCNDPKIKLEALRMIYQLKGLLKQDNGVTINNIMANMNTKSIDDLDAEISKLENKFVEGELISKEDEDEPLK